MLLPLPFLQRVIPAEVAADVARQHQPQISLPEDMLRVLDTVLEGEATEPQRGAQGQRRRAQGQGALVGHNGAPVGGAGTGTGAWWASGHRPMQPARVPQAQRAQRAVGHLRSVRVRGCWLMLPSCGTPRVRGCWLGSHHVAKAAVMWLRLPSCG